MKLHHYESNKDYIRAQVRANREKLDFVWVRNENVEQIVSRLRRFGMSPRVGLCHGTRGGEEQKLFMQHMPGCAVLGTEIAPTAASFPMTVRWDFHDSLWEGVCDFVYSNSLDHASDPKRALRAWLTSLVPDGVLIIEWGSDYEQVSESDPFGATVEELLMLIAQCGGEVLAVDDAVAKRNSALCLKIIYVRRAQSQPAEQHDYIEREEESLPDEVRRIPSMGGREIGRYLQQWASEVKDGHDIVELGVWLGAGTAQMARGVGDRSVTVWGFDRFRACASQVKKARKQGVILRPSVDTLPVVMGSLILAGVLEQCTLIKGTIPPMAYTGRPIGLHVDDACKRGGVFLRALKTFGPHWIPGVTVVVLMDFWYFERKPTVRGLEFQYQWMVEHRACFEVLMDRMPGVSGAAFRYIGGEPWNE